jgi:predicted HicB family RNase H-like nuclease
MKKKRLGKPLDREKPYSSTDQIHYPTPQTTPISNSKKVYHIGCYSNPHQRRLFMKNTITYKNFIGSISFSSEDEVFHGKIEGIDDLVTFEGTTVEELKNAFYEAVDDYLETCAEIGKKPEKSYKGTFNIRIKPELHQKIARKALIKGYSLNQFVEKALEDFMVKEPD